MVCNPFFAPAAADVVSVVLIATVWTPAWLLLYGALAGGTVRLAALTLLGVIGSQEGRHVVAAVMKGGYDPGLVTCIPYVIVGNKLVKAAWHEFKQSRTGSVSAAPFTAPQPERSLS